MNPARLLVQQPEVSAPGMGVGQGPAALRVVATPVHAHVATPEPEAASPRGAYSTLAAHDRAPQEASLGHELPSCFGKTDPNLRMNSPPRVGVRKPSQHADAASDSSSRDSTRDRRSSRELSIEAPARSTSPDKDIDKTKGSSQPLSGLRDLLAPVGGLFKGAFGVSSNEGSAQDSSSRAKPDSSHYDSNTSSPEGKLREDSHTDMSGQAKAKASESADGERSADMMELSEKTLVHCPEIGADASDELEASEAPPFAKFEQHPQKAEAEDPDATDERQQSVDEQRQQAKEDLMEVFSSQNSAVQPPAVHTSSFAASMSPQQVCIFSGMILTTRLRSYTCLHLSLCPCMQWKVKYIGIVLARGEFVKCAARSRRRLATVRLGIQRSQHPASCCEAVAWTALHAAQAVNI